MRILKIENSRILIQVNETELDTIVNNYLDQQYMIGYEEGFNDWQRACENASVDADRTEDDSQKNNS